MLPKTGHRIGRHLVAAEYNTSLVGVHSLVRCQVPQQASGFYSLEITHNGRDFTSSGLIFEHVDSTINDAFPRQLNPSGGTLITVQGAGFRDGLLCRTGLQEVAVMAAVSSSALLVCETLAVQEQNLHDSIYLSIVASRQQSSLSDMYDLVIDGARVKGARSIIHRNTRTDEIVIEGQGLDINLRNAWCKVGTLVVRGMVLSSSRLSCKLPLIARKCPPLLVSFNHVDFTAVEDIEWDSTRCISHENSYQSPVSVEWRTLNAAWQQENVHGGLEKHMDFTNSEEALHDDDRNIQPSVYSVYPAKSLRDGGIIHSFFGNSLTTQTFCRFNGFFVQSHYVSSVLALCESPAYDELGKSWVVHVGDTLKGNRVIEGSGHSIDVTPHSMLLGATPESGSTAGGTLLQLTGTFNAETVQECKLSNIRIFNVRWVSSSQLECVTPAKHKGKALITIYSDRERQMTFNYMHDPYHDGLSERAQTYESTSSSEFSRVPKIMNFFPRVIGASGGTVTVAGISLSQELIQDLTGGHGSYVSSAIILLEVNSGSSGEYASLIEPASILDPQSARLQYEDEVSITSVHPISGSAEGGTSLVMSSDFLLNDVPELSCRIASFTPISGRWIGSTLAECISPAHRVETVVVGIANGLVTTVMPSDVKYAYHSTSVSLVGNVQQVDLIKKDWIESAHAGCTPHTQYDTSVRKRSQHEVTTFDMTWTILASACNASPHNSGFQAAVVDGNRGMNAQVQYYYVSTPTVLAVIPQIVDSGRQHPVHVMGNNFDKATLFCTSGSIRTPATMISSAIVICELPEHDDGEVLVSVGARQASMNVGVITFYEHSEVIDVLPASGPDEGGTLVSVTMRQTKVTPWQCKFGTVGPVAGREAMDTAFQCVSPARLLGPCSFAAVVSSTSNSYSSIYLFHGAPDSAVGALPTRASITDLHPCSMKSLMVESTLISARSVVFDDHTKSFCMEFSSTVGFAAVIVSNSKPRRSTFLTNIQIEVTEAPVFHEIVPDSVVSSGGSLIQLFGENMISRDLLNARHCMFAHTTKPAHTISSAVITCEVPAVPSLSASDVDDTSTEKTMRAPSLGSKMGIEQMYRYFDFPSLERLVPERGPSRGGTRLHLHGAHFSNSRDLSCKLGTLMVRAALISEQEILCITPSHEHDSVVVDVSINGREGSGGVRMFDFLI